MPEVAVALAELHLVQVRLRRRHGWLLLLLPPACAQLGEGDRRSGKGDRGSAPGTDGGWGEETLALVVVGIR